MTQQANRGSEDPWKAHISYLEDEVKKINERADKVEAMVPDLRSEQKKHAARQLARHLRGEISEHRKYLALIKPK